MAVKIRTIKELEDNLYSVTIEVAEFSGSDVTLADKFGEPEIQIGGTFVSGPDTAVLPPAIRKLPSNFPIVEQFHGDDYTDAGALASVYAADILAIITTEVGLLRAMSDSFSGESVVTIP